VNVPEGGVGDVKIGLRGTTDVFFPLDSDPATTHRPATVSRAKAASAASLSAGLVLALTLTSFAALALVAAALQRRRTRTIG
jgi:hypothetical protein